MKLVSCDGRSGSHGHLGLVDLKVLLLEPIQGAGQLALVVSNADRELCRSESDLVDPGAI
jgi:hypothetical protein